jgi:hypothetical protein
MVSGKQGECNRVIRTDEAPYESNKYRHTFEADVSAFRQTIASDP